ncbi:hypothetical protein LTS18_011608 [Coniosporium uncinatum]|uniref:Uncharacterized protein n=1 Tax=Coniosporium uncinatum TaxID=93489 RepID=A0ACC3DVX1_9PEZI|nr:hypothetical protein LTS18_011608 [Coniosporium uncinatum]
MLFNGLFVTSILFSAASAGWWNHAEQHKRPYRFRDDRVRDGVNYTTVTGYFLQNDPATNTTGFDYCYWSELNGNGTVRWDDADLTAGGIEQALIAKRFWASRIFEEKMQVPQSYYTSPLSRCTRTANLTFDGLPLPRQYPFDSTDGVLAETPVAQDARSTTVLNEVFTSDDSTWISITSHSGEIRSLLRVLGHREFSLSTGAIIPVLVKAEYFRQGEIITTPAWTATATCTAPPITSLSTVTPGCVCPSGAPASERLGTGFTVEAVYQIILLEYLHGSYLAQFTQYDKHEPGPFCFYEEALTLQPRFEDLLTRLHTLCITHNSIKACNLFVESDSHELKPRLLDLGRAEISVPTKYQTVRQESRYQEDSDGLRTPSKLLRQAGERSKIAVWKAKERWEDREHYRQVNRLNPLWGLVQGVAQNAREEQTPWRLKGE